MDFWVERRDHRVFEVHILDEPMRISSQREITDFAEAELRKRGHDCDCIKTDCARRLDIPRSPAYWIVTARLTGPV